MSSRRRGAGVVLAGAMLVASSGCALNLDGRGVGVPVTLSSQTGEKVVGAPFSITRHTTYAFWGLATINHPSLARLLEGQLMGAKAVADVRVKVRSRWSDLLFTVLTAGIVVPRSVTVTGTIVGVAPPDTTAALKPAPKKDAKSKKDARAKTDSTAKADSTAKVKPAAVKAKPDSVVKAMPAPAPKPKVDSIPLPKPDSTMKAKPDSTKP